ncbi:hypothetical protein [Bacteriovorax sp. Seq25_V]|uniref:hypothetical protein n=1 Tax=Bacteriovorax sp. Seq25_V TaxID=1201288 RepID=UPI00038A266B|nr:hypothetical protein [Bacteriovorax sp. Seq25_V]EQC47254.1 hypothetical protein M900_1015 [Bacteriovorax sp. Seq25_V]
MKKIFLLGMTLLSFNSFAGEFLSNQECISVYRDGYLELRDYTESFNEGRIDNWSYSTLVAGVSTEVSVHRLACLAVESPANTKCVEGYKEIYKGLRSKIKLGSIISGNQKKVGFTESMQTVIDTELVEKKDESVIGKISNFLKIGKGTVVEEVKKARDITLVEYLDQKCDQ